MANKSVKTTGPTGVPQTVSTQRYSPPKDLAPNGPLSTEVQQLHQPIGYLNVIREEDGGPPITASILCPHGDPSTVLEQCTLPLLQGEVMQDLQGVHTQGLCYE
jgi:hypothetical protein